MGFADDYQVARAARVLLSLVSPRLAEVAWSRNRPTVAALELVEGTLGDRNPMRGISTGETFLVRATVDLWNGYGDARLRTAIHQLDARMLGALCGLIVAQAAGPEGVDAWIAETCEREGVIA